METSPCLLFPNPAVPPPPPLRALAVSGDISGCHTGGGGVGCVVGIWCVEARMLLTTLQWIEWAATGRNDRAVPVTVMTDRTWQEKQEPRVQVQVLYFGARGQVEAEGVIRGILTDTGVGLEQWFSQSEAGGACFWHRVSEWWKVRDAVYTLRCPGSLPPTLRPPRRELSCPSGGSAEMKTLV